MGDDYVSFSDCLCTCETEERPKTRNERMIDALKIMIFAPLIVAFVALASIGLISVYYTVLLNS